jgi:hypothetical protein
MSILKAENLVPVNQSVKRPILGEEERWGPTAECPAIKIPRRDDIIIVILKGGAYQNH